MRDYNDIKLWKDIDAERWNNWKWQLKNRITTAEQLGEILRITETEKREIGLCLQKFRMSITPYYVSLIDTERRDCPIRRQSVPSVEELTVNSCEMDDPLCEEHFSPVENIVHRYPDRVLFLLTRKCSMYCRHCTRRRVVGEEDYTAGPDVLEKAFGYIKNNEKIRDVLLSGGDPLMMPDNRLEQIISRLRDIPHVEIIRIGTRIPVVLPMRITDGLVKMLKKYHPIWINTHFNHPAEITPLSERACGMMADAGIPLGNQSVLLKGVNDDAEILKKLFTCLAKIRVRPYYLYQCDVAKGISHFRTPVETGMEIMGKIRGYISGYAVPTFVIDAPGGGGKIPLNPEYLISVSDEMVIMRNYKGSIYTYPNIPKNVGVKEFEAKCGVLGG